MTSLQPYLSIVIVLAGCGNGDAHGASSSPSTTLTRPPSAAPSASNAFSDVPPIYGDPGGPSCMRVRGLGSGKAGVEDVARFAPDGRMTDKRHIVRGGNDVQTTETVLEWSSDGSLAAWKATLRRNGRPTPGDEWSFSYGSHGEITLARFTGPSPFAPARTLTVTHSYSWSGSFGEAGDRPRGRAVLTRWKDPPTWLLPLFLAQRSSDNPMRPFVFTGMVTVTQDPPEPVDHGPVKFRYGDTGRLEEGWSGVEQLQYGYDGQSRLLTLGGVDPNAVTRFEWVGARMTHSVKRAPIATDATCTSDANEERCSVVVNGKVEEWVTDSKCVTELDAL